MVNIHPTAIVDPSAELAADVTVGPYSVIGPKVRIDAGTKIHNHVTITGRTTIGCENIFYPSCSIGTDPQDFKFNGEDSELVIGNQNVFREFVTVNKGTDHGGGRTVVGNHGYFMACSHIAHDCILEDHVVLANCVLLGGHIKVERHASIGGQVCIHHFVTVGQHAFIGGCSGIGVDVPPYMIIQGLRAEAINVNVVGLRRRGFSGDAIQALRKAHQILYRMNLPKPEALDLLSQENGHHPEIRYLVDFLRRAFAGNVGRQREPVRYASAEVQA